MKYQKEKLRNQSHSPLQKKRNSDLKRRSRTLTVCRWHDTIHRKPKRNYWKITRANQRIQQSQDTRSIHRITCTPLHSNHEKSEREIKESVSFTIAKRIKYLGMNLPKETKDLYMENY